LFYQEALDYIRNIERSGSDYGIERMRELLLLLGEPDRRLKFVHVAGTNGKGSVCAYLTSILKESGYRVGTYISPSVVKYNERFLINGEMLSDDDLARYMTSVREVIEREQERRAQCTMHDSQFTIKEKRETINSPFLKGVPAGGGILFPSKLEGWQAKPDGVFYLKGIFMRCGAPEGSPPTILQKPHL